MNLLEAEPSRYHPDKALRLKCFPTQSIGVFFRIKIIGRFELADEGTICLNEIGVLPYELHTIKIISEGKTLELTGWIPIKKICPFLQITFYLWRKSKLHI